VAEGDTYTHGVAKYFYWKLLCFAMLSLLQPPRHTPFKEPQGKPREDPQVFMNQSQISSTGKKILNPAKKNFKKIKNQSNSNPQAFTNHSRISNTGKKYSILPRRTSRAKEPIKITETTPRRRATAATSNLVME
jgi:hypothetical protein